jgi:cysteine synthase
MGRIPPLWNPKLADEIMTVSSDEAVAKGNLSANGEALFAGTLSGANVGGLAKGRKKVGSKGRPLSRLQLTRDSGICAQSYEREDSLLPCLRIT